MNAGMLDWHAGIVCWDDRYAWRLDFERWTGCREDTQWIIAQEERGEVRTMTLPGVCRDVYIWLGRVHTMRIE